MCAGFPLEVLGVSIRTSEALYQAMRFPQSPEIQREILDERSPMAAKMRSKKYQPRYLRADWDELRVEIMWWVLNVKLLQNSTSFGTLLKKSGSAAIVEESAKDSFWGATRVGDHHVGANTLGRLLMNLRARGSTTSIATPDIGLRLLGEEIPSELVATSNIARPAATLTQLEFDL